MAHLVVSVRFWHEPSEIEGVDMKWSEVPEVISHAPEYGTCREHGSLGAARGFTNVYNANTALERRESFPGETLVCKVCGRQMTPVSKEEFDGLIAQRRSA